MLVGCAMTAVGSSARAAIARNREMPAGYTELSTAGELS
jgi:hypothetical protein